MNVETPVLPRFNTRHAPLQWSHVSMNVETCAGEGHIHIEKVASMEPRFDERGNIGVGVVANGVPGASMEPRFDERGNIALISSHLQGACLLQWSHVSMNVETELELLQGLTRGKASMEPRFDERGNITKIEPKLSFVGSFNGATFR